MRIVSLVPHATELLFALGLGDDVVAVTHECDHPARALELPRVEYAVAVHAGSVDDADRTYAALGAAVAQRAIGVQGPIREDYLVGAHETPDETEHRTEISWPVFQTLPAERAEPAEPAE